MTPKACEPQWPRLTATAGIGTLVRQLWVKKVRFENPADGTKPVPSVTSMRSEVNFPTYDGLVEDTGRIARLRRRRITASSY